MSDVQSKYAYKKAGKYDSQERGKIKRNWSRIDIDLGNSRQGYYNSCFNSIPHIKN